MKDLIKGILGLMAFFALYMVIGLSTGCGSLGECNPSQAIDFSNPTTEESALMAAVGTSILCLPFAGLAMFFLMISLFRVTASEQTKLEADVAVGMGEHGVGTWLFAGRRGDKLGNGCLSDSEVYLLTKIGRPRGRTYQARGDAMWLELRRQGLNEREASKLVLSDVCQRLLK